MTPYSIPIFIDVERKNVTFRQVLRLCRISVEKTDPYIAVQGETRFPTVKTAFDHFI